MVTQDIDVLGQMVMARRVKQRLFGASAPGRGSRYVPIERIGRGGGGIVYRAYDAKLRREVAIKLLHLSQDSGIDQERASQVMMREARSLAALSHPHIVAVHDVGRVVNGELVSGIEEGQSQEGPLFLVMEYIEGQDLGSYLKERRAKENLSYEEILQLFEQAASGLRAAHEVGLVHRDFKPGNALVGKDGRVRVIDFGLAREEAVRNQDSTTAPMPSAAQGDDSMHSGMVGTPAYMSPEARDRMPMGPKADQFSFAVAFYEAIYGLRPLACTPQEMPAKMPATLHALPEGTPPDLQTRLAKGLQVDPNRRYENIEALVGTLRKGKKLRLWRWWPALVGPLLALGGWVVWNQQMLSVCDDNPDIHELSEQVEGLRAIKAGELASTAEQKNSLERLLTTLDAEIDGARERCMRGLSREPGKQGQDALRRRSVQAWLAAAKDPATQPYKLWAWAREINLMSPAPLGDDEDRGASTVSESQWARCTQALIEADRAWVRHQGQSSDFAQDLSACWNVESLDLRVQLARRLGRIQSGGHEAAKLAYYQAVEQRRPALAREMAMRVGQERLDQGEWREAQLWVEQALAWHGGEKAPTCPALQELQARVHLARDPRPEHFEEVIATWSDEPKLQRASFRLRAEHAMRLADQGRYAPAAQVRVDLMRALESTGPGARVTRVLMLHNVAEYLVQGQTQQAGDSLSKAGEDPKDLELQALRLWLGLQGDLPKQELASLFGGMQGAGRAHLEHRTCANLVRPSWTRVLELERGGLERLSASHPLKAELQQRCPVSKMGTEKLNLSFARDLLARREAEFQRVMASKPRCEIRVSKD